MATSAGLAALMRAMNGMNVTGGANNQPGLKDPYAFEAPSANNTPQVGETRMTVTPSYPQTESGGVDMTVRPGLRGALSRANTSFQNLYNTQPGTVASLLGMLSKSLTAGKSTYASSYYQGGVQEKPTVAGALGDLALQLGQSRSIQDYFKTGDEGQLALVNPQNAALARDRLDQQKGEEQRKKEREEDLFENRRRYDQQRSSQLASDMRSWRLELENIGRADRRDLAMADFNLRRDKWNAMVENNRRAGGKSEDVWRGLDHKEIMRAQADEYKAIDKKYFGKPYESYQKKLKVDREAMAGLQEQINSGDPVLMAPAISSYNAMLMSRPELRLEDGLQFIEKMEKGEPAVYYDKDGEEIGGRNTYYPVFSDKLPEGAANAPADFKTTKQLEAEAKAERDAVGQQFAPVVQAARGQVTNPPAPAPVAPPAEIPPMPSYADSLAAAGENPLVKQNLDPKYQALTFAQVSYPNGPPSPDMATMVADDGKGGTVTIQWSEENGRWE